MFDWEGEYRYAKYTNFNVAPESDNYRVRFTGYTGNAGGDSLGSNANGRQFTTYDRDNDHSPNNCAVRLNGDRRGGFWYGNCGQFTANGHYSYTSRVPFYSGIHWYAWHGGHYSLKAVSMAFRATN